MINNTKLTVALFCMNFISIKCTAEDTTTEISTLTIRFMSGDELAVCTVNKKQSEFLIKEFPDTTTLKPAYHILWSMEDQNCALDINPHIRRFLIGRRANFLSNGFSGDKYSLTALLPLESEHLLAVELGRGGPTRDYQTMYGVFANHCERCELSFVFSTRDDGMLQIFMELTQPRPTCLLGEPLSKWREHGCEFIEVHRVFCTPEDQLRQPFVWSFEMQACLDVPFFKIACDWFGAKMRDAESTCEEYCKFLLFTPRTWSPINKKSNHFNFYPSSYCESQFYMPFADQYLDGVLTREGFDWFKRIFDLQISEDSFEVQKHGHKFDLYRKPTQDSFHIMGFKRYTHQHSFLTDKETNFIVKIMHPIMGELHITNNIYYWDPNHKDPVNDEIDELFGEEVSKQTDLVSLVTHILKCSKENKSLFSTFQGLSIVLMEPLKVLSTWHSWDVKKLFTVRLCDKRTTEHKSAAFDPRKMAENILTDLTKTMELPFLTFVLAREYYDLYEEQ